MNYQNRVLVHALVFCAVLLQGCVAAAVGTAAAVTVTSVDVVHDRRTVGSYIDDAAIEFNMRQYLVSHSDLRRNAHISATSMNGILLLSGETPSEKMRDVIVDHGKKIDGVRQVVNEIRISGQSGFMSRTNDTWITAKAKTRLFKDTGLDANRVKVVTEYGNVYLLGLVTRAEAAAATEAVRDIGGVLRVVKVFEYSD